MIVRQQAYHDHRHYSYHYNYHYNYRNYHTSHDINMIIIMLHLRQGCLARPIGEHKQKHVSCTLQNIVCQCSSYIVKPNRKMGMPFRQQSQTGSRRCPSGSKWCWWPTIQCNKPCVSSPYSKGIKQHPMPARLRFVWKLKYCMSIYTWNTVSGVFH